ncbi:DciA family protein [Saxibacter everestensis]|uniref:DciA family protein n=1 Tax=Saxibacter everestensis TaxID=2909229 RepID=A0ABY8QYP1_9MICO|nr:DciA family protein [Brevibacteriaceae bacterium ZFBP1038]
MAEIEADPASLALNRARAAAKEKGLRPGRAGKKISRNYGRTIPGRSGPGPDERDPQAMQGIMQRLIAERGWSTSVNVGSVMGRWPEIVGRQVAEHSKPVSFDKQVLIVAADSTAWATQLRLMVPALLKRLAEELGDGVVEQVKIQGPAAPSWKRGRYRVHNTRGPRDTYG